MDLKKLFWFNRIYRNNNQKIFWFDTETTGVDKKKNGIVQIAAIIEVNGEIVGEFESKCKLLPGKEISYEALETNGFNTDECLNSFPDPKEVYKKLSEFAIKYNPKPNKHSRYLMAGYNSSFDCDMLAQWHEDITLDKWDYWKHFQFAPIDILPICRILRYVGVINTPNTKLGSLCSHFGIEIKEHDALSDIKATRQLTNTVLNILFTDETLSKIVDAEYGNCPDLPF